MHTQNHQTGPTSLSGKAVSCLNSLTHGGASQTLFLPGENPADFYALLEDVFAEFQPGTLYAAGITADAAVSRWLLWRRQRALIETESALAAAKTHQTDWSEADLHRLGLFDRYKTQAERAARRAFVNVEALRKETAREMHWQIALDLQKQRFALQSERFLLAKDKQTRLAPEQELKARHAADSLAALDRERDLDEYVRSQPFEGKPSVSQDIWITTSEEGETLVEILQSNQEIRSEIAARQQSKYPPQVVVRCFSVEGPIPGQFAWLTDEKPTIIPADQDDDDGGNQAESTPTLRYSHPMRLDTFHAVSAKEDSGGDSSILCHFPFEDEKSA